MEIRVNLNLIDPKKGKAIGICPLCKVRYIHEKDKERNNSPTICETCDKRIHHKQVEKWIESLKSEKTSETALETIWTTEIKDKNDRIALISLKFELQDWLNGNMLNTLSIRHMDHKDFEYFKEKIKSFIILLLSDIPIDITLQQNKKVELNDKNIKKEIKDIKDEISKDNKISSDKTLKDYIFNLLNILKEIRTNDWYKYELNQFAGKIQNIKKYYKEIGKKIGKSIFSSKLLDNFDNPFSKLAEEAYGGSIGRGESFNDFIRQIFFGAIVGTKWEEWIKSTSLNSKIDWNEQRIKWKEFKDENDPALDLLSMLLLQFLIRKNPSPARLRRVWESTEEFFKKVKKEVLDKNALEIPDWRRKRIVFEVDYSESIKMTGEELEGNGLLFWAQPEKDKSKIKIYLISSIEDFIEKYGTQEIKEKIKNNERLDINQDSFEDFKIELKRYSEREDRGVENVILTLEKRHLKEIHEYMPYASITDPTPVSWQIIIPAEYVPKFIDFVMEKYDKEFKYVYGKLPIHIGIIIQDYKKPLYIGLQALRKIKRNVRDINKLYIKDKSKDFCSKQRNKLALANCEEKCNSTEEYYSLYWHNSDNKDYLFYIKPDNNWKKWISTSYRFCSNDKITIIPNTFDFEFIDTNTRRNDIYYDENNYKRALYLKSNRPYEIETYWEKFKVFKELFKEKVSSSKLQKLVYVFYDKLENYEQNYNYLLASSVVNILELQKNQEAQKLIAKIFDLEDGKDILQELSEKLNEEKIKLFLDMFEFWHTALKEV